MNKHITDLTEQEVREFIKDLGDELVECSFDKKKDEILCKVSFNYWLSLEDKTTRVGYQSVILSDPYYYDNGEKSLYYLYGEEALQKWKQFCFAKEIYPDWTYSNPYTKAHVIQLTNEQLELIKTALDFMQTKIIERDGDCGQDISDLLKYLKQFEAKNQMHQLFQKLDNENHSG